MTVIFEDDDITTLNRARSLLSEVSRRAEMTAYDASATVNRDEPLAQGFGRVAEAADMAADAIFNVLNAANARRVQKLSEEQLHNRAAPVSA